MLSVCIMFCSLSLFYFALCLCYGFPSLCLYYVFPVSFQFPFSLFNDNLNNLSISVFWLVFCFKASLPKITFCVQFSSFVYYSDQLHLLLILNLRTKRALHWKHNKVIWAHIMGWKLKFGVKQLNHNLNEFGIMFGSLDGFQNLGKLF